MVRGSGAARKFDLPQSCKKQLTLIEQNQPIELLPTAPVDELIETRPPRPVLRDEGLVRAEHDALVVPAPQVPVW